MGWFQQRWEAQHLATCLFETNISHFNSLHLCNLFSMLLWLYWAFLCHAEASGTSWPPSHPSSLFNDHGKHWTNQSCYENAKIVLSFFRCTTLFCFAPVIVTAAASIKKREGQHEKRYWQLFFSCWYQWYHESICTLVTMTTCSRHKHLLKVESFCLKWATANAARRICDTDKSSSPGRCGRLQLVHRTCSMSLPPFTAQWNHWVHKAKWRNAMECPLDQDCMW
jgi:hypothetical protein